jgi:tRNA-splicing ligase RtcB
LWITRKGAVNAEKGKLGIIPGSMGTGSFIVEGLGNEDSFNSCSHGAGRTMSRIKAKKIISLEEHAEAMKGISVPARTPMCSMSRRVPTRTSGDVIAAQSDLIKVKHRLRQVLNVKGW